MHDGYAREEDVMVHRLKCVTATVTSDSSWESVWKTHSLKISRDYKTLKLYDNATCLNATIYSSIQHTYVN